MSCCGQKRADASHAQRTVSRPATPPPVTAAPAPAPSIPTDAVTLRLTHQTSFEVQGSVSGKRYRFSGRGSMQAIDRRDADALLSTGFFERAWG